MLDNTSLSVEDLGNDEVDSEDLEEVGEILEAYVTGSIACGLEIDLFSEDDESDDEDLSANDGSEEEDSRVLMEIWWRSQKRKEKPLRFFL